MNWWEANWWNARWWFARWWAGGEGGGDADRPELRISTPFGPDIDERAERERMLREEEEAMALALAVALSEDS